MLGQAPRTETRARAIARRLDADRTEAQRLLRAGLAALVVLGFGIALTQT